jgi:hypothetical protein
MRKFFLATVATLPLLAVGVVPASSQDIKQKGAGTGVSQAQGGSGVQHKEMQGKEAQGKNEAPAKLNQSSPAHDRVVGHASPASEHADTAGRDQSKPRAANASSDLKRQDTKAQFQAKEHTSGQAASEKLKPEPNAGAKERLSTGESKGKKIDEKKGPQNEPARTTGQADRLRGENPRHSNEHTQQNGRTEGRAGEEKHVGQEKHVGEERHGVEAGGRVTLTADQRTRIERTVLSSRAVPHLERVDFTIGVGVVVPSHVRIVEVPETLVEINPSWRGDECFVARDEIVIVDHGRRVVAVVPVGSSYADSETRRTSRFGAGDIDIGLVEEVLIERGYYHGPLDGVLGPALRLALIRFQEHEGIGASGRIDERTYAALRISGRTEGRTEVRASQTEKEHLGQKQGEFEPKGDIKGDTKRDLKRDQSSISGEGRGSSKSSEPRHVNARDETAKSNGARELDKTGQSHRSSASGEVGKAPSVGEIKASEPHGGTVGQSVRTPEPSAKASKTGASEGQRKHQP